MPVDKESNGKLRQKYRLGLYDFNTLKEIRVWDITGRGFYMRLIGLILLVMCLVCLLIFFTPIKKVVPGYGDLKKDATYVQLVEKYTQLEEYIETQEVYIENLKNRFTGDIETLSEAPVNIQSTDDKIEQRVIIPEDEKLRRELERKRILEKQNPQKKKEFNPFFVAPILGSISASFKPEEGHLGIDVISKSGSPVRSVADGVIIISDWTEAHGNVIGISHGFDIISFYKHNSSRLKEEGDRVVAGEAIAIIGNTGKLTNGPHLHFELWMDGSPVNPSDQINFEY